MWQESSRTTFMVKGKHQFFLTGRPLVDVAATGLLTIYSRDTNLIEARSTREGMVH